MVSIDSNRDYQEEIQGKKTGITSGLFPIVGHI